MPHVPEPGGPPPANPPPGQGTISTATSGPWDPVGLLWTLGDALYRLGDALNSYAQRISATH
jgi:hypothetical protein